MAFVNRSGSITTGGTAQEAIPHSGTRSGFFIQNTSAGDLWFDVNATAVAASPSIKLAAGASYETPPMTNPQDAVSIIGATTGQTFTAKEW